ncbi:MAG: serine hydrolase, partial [Firmicutes bacterium]|nr:serine hydrolase [Bacillota bacterium]
MLTKEYRDSLIKQLDAMQGEVAMYYKNMVTGEEFRYHENDELQPASVIKLPVFLHYLELAAAGKIDPKEEILCTDA